MNWKIIIYIAGILLLLVVIGGIGFVIVRPTNSQRADEIKNIYTDSSMPLLGCNAWRVGLKAVWQKGLNITPEIKK